MVSPLRSCMSYSPRSLVCQTCSDAPGTGVPGATVNIIGNAGGTTLDDNHVAGSVLEIDTGGADSLTVTFSNSPLLTNGNANYTTSFGGGSRPNRVPGCNTSRPSGVPQLNEWFNTACFVSPPDFVFGNESRTDPRLRGSGVNNFDFALFKRTRFGPDEKLGLEFRSEFFNLFNRTQFAPPNTSVGSSTFGQITSIFPGTNPRLIQFGLKFLF